MIDPVVPKDPPKTQILVRYRGLRCNHLCKLQAEYERTEGTKTTLVFNAPFKRPHRIGDIVRLEASDEPGRWVFLGVDSHVDSPDDEAQEVAAKGTATVRREEKKRAKRSDLDDAIKPLQRAFYRCPRAGRAALIQWVLSKLMQ